MSEFFLEIFTEEIPAKLQNDARNSLLEKFKSLFEEKKIKFKNSKVFSVPNRLVILFDGLSKQIILDKEEKRGPSTKSPKEALEGFLRSNKITEKDVYKKQTEKGEFYFFLKPKEKIDTKDILQKEIPIILDKINWKKSMRWSDHNLLWGRPLKSLLALFNDKFLDFNYHHLKSCNFTILDKEFEDKKKIIKDYKSYADCLKKLNIVIDQNQRKSIIEEKLLKNSNKNNIYIEINEKLLSEVTDLVEQPNVLLCEFDKRFLSMPKEILVITMQHHQKYFHTLDRNGNITNRFYVIANNKDPKGYIKAGNERVVEARLNDAEFFWNKNKNQNLFKQVSKLKNMNYFKGLGTYFDKIQRMRKLGGVISDELLISKDKIEISCSICKTDLLSDLVGEFPELQGVMGGYFAESQGFDKDISTAIKEHYLPNTLESRVPTKPFSLGLSLTDKLDTLVGFFGVNQKPTSSKDPFALRRAALGVVRLILENKKNIRFKDLINYSLLLYQEQNFKFDNNSVQNDLSEFLLERLKFYMKEKGIRSDIINAGLNNNNINNINEIYRKSFSLNKIINKENGQDIISSYKRAANIIENELKDKNLELSETADPGIFKNDFEKNLFKKIKELKKYFSNIDKDENYETTLDNLKTAKPIIFAFFDNIVVNDDDEVIKKNRLELLQMFCRTFENYINFSKIESI